MNICVFTGRLTKDPELKANSNGKNYTRFTLAVDNGKDSNGERTAIFINCVAWNKTAEYITKYFSKGSKACITSKFSSRDYTDSNGVNKSFTEFIINEIELCDSKPKQAAATPAPAPVTIETAGAVIEPNSGEPITELPFEL